MDKGAILSECGQFRYRLWRRWGPRRDAAVFIMLNPSTADACADDPTIRRCMGFARRFDYHAIEVVNLYAYRATKPADLKATRYPVGPDNDRHILEACAENGSHEAICAWGVNARGRQRPRDVLDLLQGAGIYPVALKLSQDGVPMHPLMLPYGAIPIPLHHSRRAVLADGASKP